MRSRSSTYADLKEHIGVDCSEYQYDEEYQRGVYTWYAAEDEACCLSLFFGDNGKYDRCRRVQPQPLIAPD